MKNLNVIITSIVLCLFFQFPLNAQEVKHTFAMGDSVFLIDGKPFQIISGELHYVRIPHQNWRTMMKAAKAMGLNTIGVYVFWNFHEPQKGKFDFTGDNNVAEFIKTAQEEGLWVILRPSPYVCAEVDFGGYPYWLQNEEGIKIRSKDPKYLSIYGNYLKELGKQLSGLQVSKGGNILMLQIENEYGLFGSDKEYLDINRKMYIDAGFDGPFYTGDPANAIQDGHMPGYMPAINGVENPAKVKELIKANNNGKGPYYISEWYAGWIDVWGSNHSTKPAVEKAEILDKILAAGISVNIYLLHGGTTRGFMGGTYASDEVPFEQRVTSYDFDAPLNEAGNVTDKYIQFRKVIEKYLPKGQTLPPIPVNKPTIEIPAFNLTQVTTIFDILPPPKLNPKPLTFEDLNQGFGYVLYRTNIENGKSGWLKIKDLRDYAIVFVNGKRVGILDRRLNQDSLQIVLQKGKTTLDILVENMGRINIGPYMLKNKKGITEKVTLNRQELLGWQMYSLPFENINTYPVKGKTFTANTPVLRKGTFNLKTTGDTYIDMSQWGKGCVWINGHHLGRYWEIGPQQTAFIPAVWLKTGSNEVVVLELLKPEQSTIIGIKSPILDKPKIEIKPSTNYRILNTAKVPVIDGDISEFAKADSISFGFNVGAKATIKVLWDNNALYIAVKVADKSLTSIIANRDGNIWGDDAIEFFIDNNNNKGKSMNKDDFQFVLNLLNTQVNFGKGSGMNWTGVWQSAVKLYGSINDDTDTDKGYIMEIAIPWNYMDYISAPPIGKTIGLDFALYETVGPTTNYIMWPSIKADFQVPDKWQTAVLSGSQVNK